MVDDKNVIADIQTLQEAGATDDEIKEIVGAKYKIDVDKWYEEYNNKGNDGPSNDSPINGVEEDNTSGWGYETDEALAGEDSDFSSTLKSVAGKGLANAQYIKDANLWRKAMELSKRLLDKGDKNLLHFLVGGKGASNLSVPFSQLSKAQQATLLKQAAGKVLGAAVTVGGTMYDVNQDNKKALTKSTGNVGEDFLYSLLDSIDRATEYAPVVSLVDLGGDLAGAAVGKDENGESYSKGGLVSKVTNAVEGALGIDNGARTFWQNTPEEQLKDLEARKWMKNQGFEGEWGNGIFGDGLSAKEGSKADVMLKNDKAIDKIQGNTKGRGEKATDGESADLEQQHKKDANMYISWKNRSEGKKLDAKDAYTYSDFTKEFVQAPDGSWKKKKGGADAGDLWRKMKKNYEKPEGDTINI